MTQRRSADPRRPTRRAALLAAVAAGLLRPRQAAAQLTDYRLGPGDKIEITVFGQADLSVEATVSANGDITMPLLGQVKAASLTVFELQELVAQRLNESYVVEPRISIEVLNYRPFFILGEVEKPGKYEYVVGLTVRMAVAVGGGYTRRAREDVMLLVRENKEAETIRYRAFPDTFIFPGDTIEVLRRVF